jgi:hypothetical protein
LGHNHLSALNLLIPFGLVTAMKRNAVSICHFTRSTH